MFKLNLISKISICLLFSLITISAVFAKNDYRVLLNKMKEHPQSLSLDEYVEVSNNFASAITNPFSNVFEILNIENRKISNKKLLALYTLESSFLEKISDHKYFESSEIIKVNKFLESYLKTLDEILNGLDLLKIENELSYMNRSLDNEYSFLQDGHEARILVAELNRRTSTIEFNIAAEEIGIYEQIDFKNSYEEFINSKEKYKTEAGEVLHPSLYSYWQAIGKFMLNKSFANKLEVTGNNFEQIKEQSYYIRPLLQEILNTYYTDKKPGISNLEEDFITNEQSSEFGIYKYVYNVININSSNTNFSLTPGIYQCSTDCKINTVGKFNMHPLSLIIGKYIEKQNRISIVEIAADSFGEVFVDLSVPENVIPTKRNNVANAVKAIYKTVPACPYNICAKRQNNPLKKNLGGCELWVLQHSCTQEILVVPTAPAENGLKGKPGINAGSLVIAYKDKSHVSGNILLIAHAGKGGDGGDAGKGIVNGKKSSDNCPDGFAGIGGNGGNGGIMALNLDDDYARFSNHYNIWAIAGKSGEQGSFGRLNNNLEPAQNGKEGKISEYIGSFFQLLNISLSE